MTYPRALFIIVGWYASDWWVGTEEEQQELIMMYGCTLENREAVLDHLMAARKSGRLFTDASRVADSGIVCKDHACKETMLRLLLN